MEKAYYRVPGEVLWRSMKMKGVPGKYRRLVRAVYGRISTYICSAAGDTDEFNVAVSLHQGSDLNSYLFIPTGCPNIGHTGGGALMYAVRRRPCSRWRGRARGTEETGNGKKV